MDPETAKQFRSIKARLGRVEVKPPGRENTALTVEDEDGVPSVSPVTTIKVSNGTLTDDGGGVVSIQTANASTLEVREEDGTPDVSNVTIIRVSNGTLTDNGGGDVSIDTTPFNLTVKESDGSPSVSNVDTIAFDGATVTDNGGGQVTVTVSGSSLTVEEQDGTPTVANVNTIKVSNGTLTDDGGGVVSIAISPGGSNLWNPDLPPSSPSSYDDEFDSAGALSGAWSLWDEGSLFVGTPDVQDWGASCEVAGATPQTAAAIYQTFPGTAGDFSIITKVSINCNIYGVLNDEYSAGLIIGEDFDGAPATSQALAWGIRKYTGSGDWSLFGTSFADYQTPSTAQNYPATGVSDAMYMRLRHDYDAGTPANSKIWFDWSTNGLAWITIGSMTRPFAPLNIGLFITDHNGTEGMAAFFSFFRETSDVSFLNNVLRGNRG